MSALTPAEIEQLAQKLDEEPQFELIDTATIIDTAQLCGSYRYLVGDLIRVPRTSGAFSLGVITRASKSSPLTVLLRTEDGAIRFKEMTSEAVDRSNPLKIGDCLEIDNTLFWVAGLDDDGQLLVLSKTGHRVDPKAVRKRIDEQLEDLSERADTVRLPQIGGRKVQTRTPTQPLPVSRPLDPNPYVPIEAILLAEPNLGLIAGNHETDTVYQLRSPLAGAALHTNKGHNYKSWNEDGGALFADGDGRLYLGVFDQAGGMGSDKHARGAASAIAAQTLFDEVQVVAESHGSLKDGEEALVRAAHKAHKAIIERDRGEVTTYIGAMLEKEEAVIVNVGDSGAMHFSSTGEHQKSTALQGVGIILLQGLGMRKKEVIEPEIYHWKIAAGDYLVFGSDGLLDSKLKPKEIGEMLHKSESAADATRRLRDVVSERMKSKKGKPDNLTVLVVRVGEPV